VNVEDPAFDLRGSVTDDSTKDEIMTNRPASESRKDLATVHSSEAVFTPSLFQTLFWKPRFLLDAAILAHLPFVFWLSVVLNPRRVAVLGCGDGAAHFALCQSLDKLGLDSLCHGFGFWNEANAGNLGAPPEALKQHEAMLYEDLSSLTSCESLEDALERIEEGTVDLMLIDLANLPSNIHLSGEFLLSLLSERGVILFHSVNDLNSSSSDCRSLERFIKSAQRIRFPAGEGLAVIIKDEEPPTPLRSLLQYAPNGKLRGDIELMFRRSGQNLRNSVNIGCYKKNLQDRENILTVYRLDLEAAKDEVRSLRQSHELRSQKLADTQVQLFERSTELERVRAELVNERKEFSHQVGEIEFVTKKNKEIEAALSAVDAELRAASRTIIERDRELADLRNQLEESASARAVLQNKVDELSALRLRLKETNDERDQERKARFKETAALTRIAEELRVNLFKAEVERRELQGEKDTLERWIDELLHSTSWWITAPMRFLKRAFDRRSS